MASKKNQDFFWEDIRLPPGHEGRAWEFSFPWRDMKTPHRHDLYEANLITTGRGAYLIEGRRVELLPGTLIWLRPNQAHQLLKVNHQFSMDIWLFEDSLMRRFLQENHPLFQAQTEEIQLTQLSHERSQWLSRLKSSLDSDASPHLVNTVVSFAFLEFIREDVTPHCGDRKVSSSLKKALDLLHQKDHSLGSLSLQVDCHPTWLSRQFKNQLGISLTDYRQDLKLQKFIDLRRENPNRTLISVALDAGFGSYAQFHRVFKKSTGKVPRAFFP